MHVFLSEHNIFTLSFNWIKKYNIIQDCTITRYFLKNILKCMNYILYNNFFYLKQKDQYLLLGFIVAIIVITI